MKAIDIRLNIALNPSTHDASILRTYREQSPNEGEALRQFCNHGCPHHLGDHFTNDCAGFGSGCRKCWEQEPYQFKENHPHWYDEEYEEVQWNDDEDEGCVEDCYEDEE